MSGQMAFQVSIPKTKFSVTNYVHVVENKVGILLITTLNGNNCLYQFP